MTEIRCVRCGHFKLSGTARAFVEGQVSAEPHRWAVTSHAIRRLCRDPQQVPLIDGKMLKAIWAHTKLPDPQQQLDELVVLVGSSKVTPGDFAHFTIAGLWAQLGTADRKEMDGLAFVLAEGKKRGLTKDVVSNAAASAALSVQLTFDGWKRFHELQQLAPESRVAFMAMGYANPDAKRAFLECFVPAVSRTGYELRRLDHRPKAGLIDNRMRVEIRASKFVVADLTDENRGAYWEAGFGEGLGRPVFYTCEAKKFEKARSHFDTEHMQTIKWTLDDWDEAADELKSAIRNTFPSEALQKDVEPVEEEK